MASMLMGPRRLSPWLSATPELEEDVVAIDPGDADYWGGPARFPIPTPTPTPIPLPSSMGAGAGPRLAPAPASTLRPTPTPTPTGPSRLGSMMLGVQRRMAQESGPHAYSQFLKQHPEPPPAPVEIPIDREREDLRRLESGLPTRSGVLPTPAGGMGAPKPTTTSAPIRALRLPNGKLIFTNQPSSYVGSSEISTGDAGRMIRRHEIEPAAVADLAPSPQGFVNSAATEDTSRRIADEMALEQADRENSLLAAAAERRMLMMSPEERARLSSPQPADLQVMQAILPQIIAARARQQEAMKIEDPTIRARAIEFENQRIEDLFRAAGIRQF